MEARPENYLYRQAIGILYLISASHRQAHVPYGYSDSGHAEVLAGRKPNT